LCADDQPRLSTPAEHQVRVGGEMEKATPARPVAVLVLGPLHPDVTRGLVGCFDVVEADAKTAPKLAPEVLSGIRGVACAGSISRSLVEKLPKLEIIASFGVGYDGIDVV